MADERMINRRDTRTPITVAGPSHARRYRNAVTTGQIAPPRRAVNWMDVASGSMLHPEFRGASFAQEPEPTLCFVPDFRIGNRSLTDPERVESYLGVSKDLISPDNDRQIYANIMNEVRRIRDNNPDARFLFWCLGTREFQNRARGVHSASGRYRHPIWNLDDVETEIGDQTISLQAIFNHPLGSMLFIDGSGHPSYIGLELFSRLTDNPDISVATHLDAIAEAAVRPVIVIPKDAVLTGDSFWLDALRLYIDKGLVRLAKGVEIVPVERLIDVPAGSRSSALFVSGLRHGSAEAIQEATHRTSAHVSSLVQQGYRPKVFVWEARGAAAINARLRLPARDARSTQALHRALADAGVGNRLIAERAGQPSFVRARDVEVSHPVGPMPTIDGLLTVVRALGGNHRLERL